MGSSRLPGKVLREIASKPVLWHVIYRLRQCQQIDQIIIATTTDQQDDAIANYAQQQGVGISRGPEANVLERYRLAAKQSNADIIIRVTGDSPLIDPTTLDNMIFALKSEQADICRGRPGPHGLKVVHEGFTPISRRAFEQQVIKGGHDPAVQEHVTTKLQEYVTDLKIAEVDFNPEHFFSEVRLSVDTPADLEFMNRIYQLLGAAPGDADLSEVVRLLKHQPELLAINAHVHQKGADEKSHQVMIRCDGDSSVGLGHVMRCLSLAQALRDQYSVGVRFAMQASNLATEHSGKALLEAALFPVDLIPIGANERDWINTQIALHPVDAIIFDIRTDLPAAALSEWRKQHLLTVCIDEPSERRLNCDLAFYPPVPQIEQMSWQGFNGTLICGWQWILLGASFKQQASFKQLPAASNSQSPQLLISMGGADPAGMTLKAIEALANVKHDHLAHVILGKAFNRAADAKALADKLKLNINFHHDIRDMAGLINTMDLAIAAFGVTAYELAACGVPSLLLSLSEEHALAAQALHRHEAACSLGIHSEVTPKQLGQQINQLLADDARRQSMREAALSLQIINGADKIAATIKDALNSQGIAP